LTYAIIFVASLNYLGLGAQPPAADWGLMVAENGPYLSTNLAAVLVPIGGIVSVSLACNLIAEALTRHLAHDFRRTPTLL
jgi:peptide/nickel transport system permease protein